MPKKQTQEEFIARATEAHKGKFNYDKTVYISASAKVTVTCPVHGDFEIQAMSHVLGNGCAACSGKKKKTTESFIAEARLIHGDKFDYSHVVYKNMKTPVLITCNNGHTTSVIPTNHLRGSGCLYCAGTALLSQEEFIRRCVEVHGDKYIYDKAKYTNSSEKVIITCKKHGDFSQQAHMHCNGQGCPRCIGLNKTTEEFVEEARKVHGDLYDYSEVVYVKSRQTVRIVCKEHGVFEQTPNSHLSGRGCSICYGRIPHTNETFIAAARKIHGNKYTYDKVEYGRNNTSPVIITCSVHGDFEQKPLVHLEGCGCQKCSGGVAEASFKDFIESLGFNTVKDRTILEGREIDVYIPDRNIGFEYNGVFWHSEARSANPKDSHKMKTDLAASRGVRLIHIYEDDWSYRRGVVERTVKHILGLTERVAYARQCKIVEQSSDTFIEANHMLGKGSAVSVSLTLIFEDKIVAAMQFSKSGSRRGHSVVGSYELTRFASLGVPGAASKLFKYFLKKWNPLEVVSYSDNDMFSGEMYEMLGFHKVGDVPPDYKIVERDRRFHKSGYTRAKLAARFGDKFDPNKTEHQNCLDLKLFRVYNSGLKKWLWLKQP